MIPWRFLIPPCVHGHRDGLDRFQPTRDSPNGLTAPRPRASTANDDKSYDEGSSSVPIAVRATGTVAVPLRSKLATTETHSPKAVCTTRTVAVPLRSPLATTETHSWSSIRPLPHCLIVKEQLRPALYGATATVLNGNRCDFMCEYCCCSDRLQCCGGSDPTYIC